MMRTLKTITIMLAAIAPLALSACTTVGTSGSVGADEPSGYNTWAPDASDAGSPEAPGQHGNVFVGSPEPGFNPDSIKEAP